MFKAIIVSKNKLESEKKEMQNPTTEIIELTRQMRDEQTEEMTKKIANELIKLKENTHKIKRTA